MAALKTQKNKADIELFISKVTNETRRTDAGVLLELMREVTSDQGSMWGDSIVGFGSYEYTYSSGIQEPGPLLDFHPANRTPWFTSCPGSSDMKS